MMAVQRPGLSWDMDVDAADESPSVDLERLLGYVTGPVADNSRRSLGKLAGIVEDLKVKPLLGRATGDLKTVSTE